MWAAMRPPNFKPAALLALTPCLALILALGAPASVHARPAAQASDAPPSDRSGDTRGTEDLDALRKAVAEDLDNVDLRKRFARALLFAGETYPAIDQLDEALRRAPDDPEIHHLLGLCYQRSGQPEEAERAFRRALAIDGTLVPARSGLAAVLAGKGDTDGAIRQLGIILDDEPDRFALRVARARLYAQSDRREEALQDLDQVLTDHPTARDAALLRANLIAEGGHAAEAASSLERTAQAIEEPEDRGLVLFNQGNLFFQAGNLDQAVDRYRKAAELLPDEAEVQFNLGSALVRRGDDEEAEKRFARALELQPDDTSTRLAYQMVLGRLGRFQQARRVLEDGLEKGEDADLTQALARLLALCPDEAACDPARALELADGAYRAEASPVHAETLALALAASGRFDEAVKLQTELVSAAKEAGAPAEILAAMERTLESYRRGARPHAPGDLATGDDVPGRAPDGR